MPRERHFVAAGILLLALVSKLEADPPPALGPHLCVDARLWNAEGWQSREDDCAFVRLDAKEPADDRAIAALRDVRPSQRMVVFSEIDGADQILHKVIDSEKFQLGFLGLDFGTLIPERHSDEVVKACARGHMLARRYGLKLLVTVPQRVAVEAGGAIAQASDLVSLVFQNAAIEDQRSLYQRLLAANPSLTFFQTIAASKEPPARLLQDYRCNADLVHGIIVGQSARMLRAIRPQLGRTFAVAPDEGPAMYFFNFLWNTAGWEPRRSDYAIVKIRPALKTLDQKVAYCLKEFQDIPPEYRKIMTNSLAGTPELLHELIDVQHFPVAALDYDLEDWELTPDDEKADPVGACKRGQALADRYRIAFVVVPDMAMSSKWAVRIAPFVAGLTPQSKGAQVKSIDEAIARQRSLYTEIRRANPAISLYHDLGAAPKGVLQSIEGLLHYYAGVADLVDGIEIWSQNEPAQNALIRQYVLAVRPPSRPGSR